MRDTTFITELGKQKPNELTKAKMRLAALRNGIGVMEAKHKQRLEAQHEKIKAQEETLDQLLRQNAP